MSISPEVYSQIVVDVGRQREPEGYNAEMLAAYERLKAEYDAMEPGWVWEVPNDLPDIEDVVLSWEAAGVPGPGEESRHPGHANQKVHGRKGGGGGTPEEHAARLHAKAKADAPAVSAMMESLVGGRKIEYADALNGDAAPPGGDLAGFENRIKSESSLARKINSDMDEHAEAGEPITTTQAAEAIGDSLRYTVRFPDNEWTEGYLGARSALEAQGYTLVKDKPTWDNNYYRGTNTNWTTPNGTTIEVQFHTSKSFQIKEQNHGDYEIYRDKKKYSATERAAAGTRMKARATTVTPPPGWERTKR